MTGCETVGRIEWRRLLRESDPGVVHDDLDALILWENGDGVFQVPTDPYSWLGPQPTDMLLFSIRRESPLTGTLDPLGSALTIEEGDILLPLSWSPTPGIFIAAEKLGLCFYAYRHRPA